jgi:tetratricopeptide (TPR) repeat protein
MSSRIAPFGTLRVARVAAGLALVLGSAFPATAQKIPKRPSLPAMADTNDARAYYALGTMLIRDEAGAASRAFYWARRLDPAYADAYYAERTALLLSDPHRLVQWDDGVKRVLQSEDVQHLDSLLVTALTINPVLPMSYERVLALTAFARYIEEEDGTKLGLADMQQLDFYFERYLHNAIQADAYKARMAQADGDYEHALQLWSVAIKHAQKKANYRVWRGRLFLQLGQADSAVAELSQALDELQARDKKEFTPYYYSKATTQTTLGMAQQQRGDVAAARAAFEGALAEDLAYYPAHVRLGQMALDQHDTTNAISEMDLAVQLRPDDGYLRDQYGYALLLVGRFDDAITQLKKAAELEPWYALALRHLGEAYDGAGNHDAAIAAFRSYVTHASRSDPMRVRVQARLASNP